MKRVIISSVDDIFAMAKIVESKADISRTGEIHDFIYFSECTSSHGPRIKFYGGTSATSTTKTAPSMSFGVNEQPKVILQSWMNKRNCPRAYDKSIIRDLKDFIEKTKPILLLVWFKRIEETDAQDYFHGYIGWDELLSGACLGNRIEPDTIKSLKELNDVCMKYNLYRF